MANVYLESSRILFEKQDKVKAPKRLGAFGKTT
jgi:hypothetical protein